MLTLKIQISLCIIESEESLHCLSLHSIGRAMRKHDFRHIRTAKDQIRLSIGAVGSGPSLSANRIIGYYRLFEWRAKYRVILWACARWAECVFSNRPSGRLRTNVLRAHSYLSLCCAFIESLCEIISMIIKHRYTCLSDFILFVHWLTQQTKLICCIKPIIPMDSSTFTLRTGPFPIQGVSG